MSNETNLQQLQKIIGEESFNKVLAEFSGIRFRIPKKITNRAARNKSIRSDHNLGLDIPDLMKKYDLSRSQIHLILGKNRS